MMLLCGKSFSQIGIQSKVTIDTTLAKKIAIDLVKGDECKVELEITKKNVLLLKEKHHIKDSMITNYKNQVDNLNKIVFGKDNLLMIVFQTQVVMITLVGFLSTSNLIHLTFFDVREWDAPSAIFVVTEKPSPTWNF